MHKQAEKTGPILFILIFSSLFLVFFSWFYFFAFPKELHNTGNIQSIEITDRNGVPLREILSPQSGRSRWVDLKEISPHLINATILAEDRRFYYHGGIDLFAIARALGSNIKGREIVSGGSTITQQLVRLAHPRKRTLLSKIYEAFIALRIEQTLSKEKILEQYLNRSPYGNQLFGIEAASQMYFGKPAKDLSIGESALLAILPRAPTAYDPYRNFEKIKSLHQQLIEKLYLAKKITKTEMEIAKQTPLKFSPRKWSFIAPHFVEMLPNNFSNKTIKTSLDIKLQTEIERIVSSNLKPLEKYNVTNAAAVVLDNKTGEILALIGSNDYHDEKNSGHVNGATSLRQPGSALKPFTYALALERGYTASSVIHDIVIQFPTPQGEYTPKNYDLKFRGPVRLRSALANSLNIPAVYTLSKLGIQNLMIKLNELSFKNLGKDPGYYGLGLTLGNGEVTLLELTTAYATLARNGTYLPHTLFPSTKIRAGKKIFSEEIAYIISDILSDEATRRASFGEDTPLNLPFRVAAKTGTSKNFKDNWTIGYTPEYTVGVWVGNFDSSAMRGISGITGAGPIFNEIFLYLGMEKQQTWFKEPKEIIHQTVCPLSGQPLSENCHGGIDEIFIRGTEPKNKCLFHVSYLIDTRNDLLATEGCDKEWTVLRSFIDLPEQYQNWAESHHIPRPPTQYSPNCPQKNKTSEENGNKKEFGITHPNNNSVYKIDPDIPQRLQILHLRAYADGPITWFVDNEKIATTTPPNTASWQIKEGRHKISIISSDGSKNDEIEIMVYR